MINQILTGLTDGGIVIAILVVIAALIIIFCVRCVKIVHQTDKIIYEKLGSYHSTWGVGIHVRCPFIGTIANRVSLKEQVKDFEPQPVITKDNVTMQIDTVVFYQVTDPKDYTYGVDNPVSAIEKLSSTTLRNIIGELDLDETLTSRDLINERMRKTLDEATDPWGIKVTRVEVKNIVPPKDIREAMEKQMRAERERREVILRAEGEKRSAILSAEGEKESQILRAEAEKETKILKAEGEAQSILRIQQANADALKMLKDVQADQAVLTLKAYDALKGLGDGPATKIIVPSDLAGIANLAVTAIESATSTTHNTQKNKKTE